MKSNITLIALNNRYKKNVAKKLANKLDMFYIDINDLLKYDVMNINEIVKVAGLDYYNMLETKAVKTVASYENTLITLSLDTFFNNNNYNFLKNSSIFIYIKLKYKDFKLKLLEERPKSAIYEIMLNEKVFNERDKTLSKLSDIVVNITETKKGVEDKIIENIKKYYKGVL